MSEAKTQKELIERIEEDAAFATHIKNEKRNELANETLDAVKDVAKICYQCDKSCSYLFDDCRCIDCTRLTLKEIVGEV